MFFLSRKTVQSGFTLLELMLSVAAITIIAGIAVPVYLGMQTKNDLNIAVSSYAAGLGQAQVSAQSSEGDSQWGVILQSGSVVIFKGASYAARDSSFDTTTALSPGVTFTGITEQVFEKQTGVPTSVGTTTFTSVSNESIVVTINTKGLVSY